MSCNAAPSGRDNFRQFRNGPLARFLEQAIVPQAGQRLFERLAPQAVTFRAQPRHAQLEISAGGVHGHLPECRYQQAVTRPGRRALHITTPHHASYARFRIS
jgi:hypothetical protein